MNIKYKYYYNCKSFYYERIQSKKINLIISAFDTDFLEDYNRYKAEIFRVLLYFNGLFKNISHFDVA